VDVAGPCRDLVLTLLNLGVMLHSDAICDENSVFSSVS
jgi:hypothetical protein